MPRPPKPPKSARERAIDLLARREHSGRELQRKLVQKGLAVAEARQLIGDLSERNLQSDRRFAGALVRRRIGDGYGPLRIRMELQSHGIDAAAGEQAIAEEAPDWPELARQAYRRKFRDRPALEATERGKRAQYLAQRGFPIDLALKVARADGDVDDG
ncbi:MAG: regulatory protein RecX [Lysobacterales bacterium]